MRKTLLIAVGRKTLGGAKVSLGAELLLVENVLLFLLGVRWEELEGQADRLLPQSWTCNNKWLPILGENWANIESVTKECGARVTVTALPIVILVVVVAPVHHPWGRVVIQVVAPSRHPLVPLHPLPHTGHLVGSKACGLFTQIVSLGPAWCTGLMVLESLFLLDTAGSTRTRLISRTYCMQRSKRLSLATRVLADVLYITQKI